MRNNRFEPSSPQGRFFQIICEDLPEKASDILLDKGYSERTANITKTSLSYGLPILTFASILAGAYFSISHK